MDIQWCNDKSMASELADFFAGNVDRDYISHGEVLDGRSVDFEEWSPDLKHKMQDSFTEAINAKMTEPVFSRIAVGRETDSTVAVALVEFRRTRGLQCLVFHDLVVDRGRRGSGIGTAVLQWVEREAKSIGIQMVILESGIKNRRAHELFERLGYRVTSLVMGKRL